MIQLPTTENMPRVNFSCPFEDCAADASYPADMMYFWQGKWYCEYCLEHNIEIEKYYTDFRSGKRVRISDLPRLDKWLERIGSEITAYRLVKARSL